MQSFLHLPPLRASFSTALEAIRTGITSEVELAPMTEPPIVCNNTIIMGLHKCRNSINNGIYVVYIVYLIVV